MSVPGATIELVNDNRMELVESKAIIVFNRTVWAEREAFYRARFNATNRQVYEARANLYLGWMNDTSDYPAAFDAAIAALPTEP